MNMQFGTVSIRWVWCLGVNTPLSNKISKLFNVLHTSYLWFAQFAIATFRGDYKKISPWMDLTSARRSPSANSPPAHSGSHTSATENCFTDVNHHQNLGSRHKKLWDYLRIFSHLGGGDGVLLISKPSAKLFSSSTHLIDAALRLAHKILISKVGGPPGHFSFYNKYRLVWAKPYSQPPM